jgi:hypothetical protein
MLKLESTKYSLQSVHAKMDSLGLTILLYIYLLPKKGEAIAGLELGLLDTSKPSCWMVYSLSFLPI